MSWPRLSAMIHLCTGVGIEMSMTQIRTALQPAGDLEPARAHGVVRIITERRAREELQSCLSRFDDLTGEMNRRPFTDVVADTLQGAIGSRTSFAMLVVSIDDLARINEAYGFAVGDEVISAVVLRLRASMRAVPSPSPDAPPVTMKTLPAMSICGPF